MPLETNTDVEQIRSVQNSQGKTDAPANESTQRVTAGSNAETVAAGEVAIGTGVDTLPAVTVPLGVTAVLVVDAPPGEGVMFGNANSRPLRRESGDGITTQVNDLSEWSIEGTDPACSVSYVVEQEDTE